MKKVLSLETVAVNGTPKKPAKRRTFADDFPPLPLMPAEPPVITELRMLAATEDEKKLVAALEGTRRRCLELRALYDQSICLEARRNAVASREQFAAARQQYATAIRAALDSMGAKPMAISGFDTTPAVSSTMSDREKWDTASKLSGKQRSTYLRKAFPGRNYS